MDGEGLRKDWQVLSPAMRRGPRPTLRSWPARLLSCYVPSVREGILGYALELLTMDATPIQGWVLHDRARNYTWAGTERASIKSFSGTAVYEVEGRRVTVDQEHYLLLNNGEPYTVTIDGDVPVESFCVFFDPGVLEEAAFSLVASLDRALDAPDGRAQCVDLLNEPRRNDDLVSPALTAFRHVYLAPEAEPLVISEAFHGLAVAIMMDQAATELRMEGIGAARHATRRELYRRLLVARDYMSAHFREQLTIKEAARAAALSPNRLISHYREAFGVTPYQDIRRMRLEEAKQRLLRSEGESVTALALALGYQSVAAFSSAFRVFAGESPRAFQSRSRSGDYSKLSRVDFCDTVARDRCDRSDRSARTDSWSGAGKHTR